jgi:hypothetical protein
VPPEGLIRLSEAARSLGYHVETLRLRIRRGELAASRGPHGTYYVTTAVMAGIGAPRRSNRQAFALEALEWTWVVLEQVADHDGASHFELLLIAQIHRNPSLNRALHHLLTVKRLCMAGLSSVEISGLTGLSTRHVRRLKRRELIQALDQAQKQAERALPPRFQEKNRRLAWRIVAGIQRRLDKAGFRYHRRPWQPDDTYTPRGRRPPAHKARKLFREEIRHLRDGGLSAGQVLAIQMVGIGQDELNELMLHGLPPARA